MHLLDGENTTAVMPTMPAVGASPGWCKAEGEVPPTQITGDHYNALTAEIVNTIEGAGLTLDKSDSTQLLQAVRAFGGRSWWRSMPWAGRDYDAGSNPMTAIFGTNYLTLIRIGTTAIAYQQTLPVPADIRGIEVRAAKVRYQCTVAFDATFTERVVKLYHVAANGTSTEIGSGTLTVASTHGSVQTLTLTMADTPILAEGDYLFAQLRLTSTASGTAVGEVHMYGFDVQFEEGHE